jgi:hypothetical protein
MADFGKGGTRTVGIFHGDVTAVGSSGDYLEYLVDAQGGNPLFVYSCQHRDIIVASHQFPGHPMAHYAWRLVGSPAAATSNTDFTPDSLPTDAYVVGFSFLGAINYKLTVNLRNAAGAIKQTVQQIQYASQFPEDSCMEGLMVTWS